MRKYRKIDFREVINLDAFKGAGKVIPKIYDDIFQPSAQTIGQSINGPLKFVTIPLRMLGPFSDILDYNINNWLEEKLKNVPDDERIIPKTNIAYPIMQNLIINLDDETLRDAFLNLLANAISEKTTQSVQKYFPYILEQMTASDALLFKQLYPILYPEIENVHLLQGLHTPLPRGLHGIINICSKRQGSNGTEGTTIYPNFFTATSSVSCSDATLSIENLTRLKLVEITYSSMLANKELYEPLKQMPLVKEIASKLPSDWEIFFEEGVITITSLGAAFGSVVLSPPE